MDFTARLRFAEISTHDFPASISSSNRRSSSGVQLLARRAAPLISSLSTPALRACGWFDHDLYVECEHHAQNRIECEAYFPSKVSVETVATQPDLLRKSGHTLSTHHVANRFRDEDRISHRERVVQVVCTENLNVWKVDARLGA